MKTDIKERWVSALRSGEYVQGRAVLHSADDKFCCLGVLCDIALKEGIVEREQTTVGQTPHAWRYFGTEPVEDFYTPGSTTTLPKVVVDWAELPDHNPDVTVDPDGLVRTLAGLNDDGAPFTEIADLIEENF